MAENIGELLSIGGENVPLRFGTNDGWGDGMVGTVSLSGSSAGAFTNVRRGSVHIPVTKAGRYQITVGLDETFRPHSVDNLPAVEYTNGEKLWYWHGVQVPEHVVTRPESITIKEIDEEENSEVRRLMIERYGQVKYLKDCNAKLLHNDHTGELYEKRFAYGGTEQIRFVKVKNSTPEPDGTFKNYILRTPPTIGKAIDAVAWTFGMEGKKYTPQVET